MHSLVRQHHIRLDDLRNFLRSYSQSSVITPQEWSKTVSANLQHGNLIFILEPTVPPLGLTSFVRKDDDQSFRVSEFAMVVRLEDDKSMVLNLTQGAYELRFLEALLEEKAKKAIVEHRKFCFILAKPLTPLAKSTINTIEQLANRYAQGGSRREFMAENANPDDEPAVSLLSACGVHLHVPDTSKQPLDLGAICHLLFSAEGMQSDSNRAELKAHFVPIAVDSQAEVDRETFPSVTLATDAYKDALPGGQIPVPVFDQNSLKAVLNSSEQVASENKEDDFSVLQSWGEVPALENTIGDSSLLKRLTSGLDKKKPSSALDIEPSPAMPAGQIPTSVPINEEQKFVEQPTQFSADDDVYQHLSQAITGLLDGQTGSNQQTGLTQSAGQKIEPNKWVAAQIEAQRQGIEQSLEQNKEQNKESSKESSKEPSKESDTRNWPSVRSFGNLPAIPDSLPWAEASDLAQVESSPLLPQELFINQTVEHEEELAPENPVDIAVPAILPSTANTVNTAKPAVFTSADIVPAKLDDFQEPKVVMNEMASLMNKLESQVARAAKKLAASATEIEQRLTANLDTMLDAVTKEGKDAEAKLVVHGDSLSKQFESLFDTLKAEFAEKAASGRQGIKNQLAEYQEQIENRHVQLHASLEQEFRQTQEQSGKVVQDQEEHFKQLVNEEKQTLLNRIDAINKDIEKTAEQLIESLSRKFAHFKERVGEEELALINTVDHNMSVLSKDIDIARVHGLDKLKKEKSDFIASLDNLVMSTETALSRQIRAAQMEFFLPRLKERKQAIESMIQEMMQTFAEQALSQAKSQLEGLENSLSVARDQLKELIEECLGKLDLVGRDQQTGLEEIFKSTAHSLEQNTELVLQLLKQSAQEVIEGEEICKKLAESYSLDGDPALTSLRQNVNSEVDALKAQLRSELELALDSHCAKLEELSSSHHTSVSAKRSELAQHVRFASEQGLQRIRAAIHDAYTAIQAEREKYM